MVLVLLERVNLGQDGAIKVVLIGWVRQRMKRIVIIGNWATI